MRLKDPKLNCYLLVPKDHQLIFRIWPFQKLKNMLLKFLRKENNFCVRHSSESVLKNFKRHESKISRIVLNNGRIETSFILPKNISHCPSFIADKQKSELCPEMYLKRIAPDSNLAGLKWLATVG
jgi:hypothetical protein